MDASHHMQNLFSKLWRWIFCTISGNLFLKRYKTDFLIIILFNTMAHPFSRKQANGLYEYSIEYFIAVNLTVLFIIGAYLRCFCSS